MNHKPEAKGLMRVIKATGYSMKGLKAAYQHEIAFRQEVVLLTILLPSSFFVARNATQWALLMGTVIIVMIVELVNSAIEAAVDRHGGEWHELSGRAKDLGSASVFMALLNLAFVWGAIFIDNYIWSVWQ